MWGQPPLAVHPSEARLGFLATTGKLRNRPKTPQIKRGSPAPDIIKGNGSAQDQFKQRNRRISAGHVIRGVRSSAIVPA
jgi:hypothetical protein